MRGYDRLRRNVYDALEWLEGLGVDDLRVVEADPGRRGKSIAQHGASAVRVAAPGVGGLAQGQRQRQRLLLLPA